MSMSKVHLYLPILFLLIGLVMIFTADTTTTEGISQATSGGFMASLGGAWIFLFYKASKREINPEELDQSTEWIEKMKGRVGDP
jgi:hypothetical protein